MVIENERILLVDGIKSLNLSLADTVVDNLLCYVQLLLRWNQKFSLTSITDVDAVIRYHILDGLTLIKYLEDSQLITKSSSIIDVGSGMGVPGVIVAICLNNKVALIDSNGKKTSFLTQVRIDLNLKNIVVISSKVEDYVPNNLYDLIISRAFTSNHLFIKKTEHMLKNSGYFIAMKGIKAYKEVADSTNDYVTEVIEVQIPGINDKRFLVKTHK